MMIFGFLAYLNMGVVIPFMESKKENIKRWIMSSI